MRSKILYIVLLFLIQFISLDGNGQTLITSFPYENSLKGSSTETPTHISPVGGTVFTSTGTQLTSTAKSQRGAVILDGASFNSTNGLIIEFDYDMYDGVMYESQDYGDGLSFFLYDGSVPTTDDLLGSNGAGLGYTYNRALSNQASAERAGLDGAYLGVALDQFGNFKGRRFQPDSYISGINSTITWEGGGHSHVTLRGAMSKVALTEISTATEETTNRRFAGYPVLITQSTKAASGTNLGAVLNIPSGSVPTLPSAIYNMSNTILSNQFDVRGGVSNPSSGQTGYRRAIIELFPADPAAGGGFIVTLKIQHGSTITTVINKFHYKTKFYYRENANRNSGTSTGDTFPILDATVPTVMKLGFAASTGGASQAHVIRNLKVSLPFQPVFVEDKVEMCTNMTRNVSFAVFPNDLMYNKELYNNPIAGATNEFIDFTSFRFENSTGSVLSSSTTYTNPNEGTWSYNSTSGQVTFTPNPGFKGLATVYYSAKGTASQGGPFNQEIYRSTSTKLTVNVVQCGGVINPHIPAGGVSRSGK